MICSTCKVDKPEDEFAWKKKGVRRATICKVCHRAHVAEHYKSNKDEYISSNRRARIRVQEYMRELKESTPCTDCDGTFHFAAMQFDHLEGSDKIATVSYLTHTKYVSWSRLLAEIEKCELVCANCHAIRTWKRSVGQPLAA